LLWVLAVDADQLEDADAPPLWRQSCTLYAACYELGGRDAEIDLIDACPWLVAACACRRARALLRTGISTPSLDEAAAGMHYEIEHELTKGWASCPPPEVCA
jgi:hypothetical protein